MIESRIRSAVSPDTQTRRAPWFIRHPFLGSLWAALGLTAIAAGGAIGYSELTASPETRAHWAQLDQQRKDAEQRSDLLRTKAIQVNKVPPIVLPDGDIATQMYTDGRKAGGNWGANDKLGEVTVTREVKTYTSVNRLPKVDIPWTATTHIDKNPHTIFVSAVNVTSAQEAEGYIAQLCGSIAGNQVKIEGGIVSESIPVASSDCILPQTS